MEKSPIVEIVKKVCPAVITIVVSKNLPKIEGFYMLPFGTEDLIMPKVKDGKKELIKIGGGSAFLISKDGLILTSRHVVEDPDADYSVILEPNKTYSVKILERDPINDIAILKIEGEDFPYLELGDSEQIEIGETVIAVGNPLGEFHDTVSAGIVSGLSRYIQASNGISKQAERLRGLIQTDAAINPGNSGGPLINMEGKVIGINTAMVMGAQNIGFAIPINYAKKDLEEIKKFGRIKVPFLGIKYIILSKDLSEKNKLPVDYGALVVREVLGESPVIKNSAAEKAGIEEFDIILEAKGEKITTDNPLSDILQKCKIGEEIELKILRKGKELIKKVKLEEKNK
ncbi:MAG TPA: trypsin-like peptidase domain-containing protein [Candidatus Pacearchaeota archaeon]|nr:trypsin-like peptidase domain-containing protein [Candidatus Pacearchaeota archaeon]HOL90635.1 trypsin-like peptidase domain-containing protein [Candidatus Pacearchaeota archaeon]HOW13039.1 trypsin-like peptidase domain-containing protein [Candidatus Pacearchaeota archaeon]HPO68209.1 trypsin-like peptidase domain-containing protein [Candidatus Pacearchaeota archaeon]